MQYLALKLSDTERSAQKIQINVTNMYSANT